VPDGPTEPEAASELDRLADEHRAQISVWLGDVHGTAWLSRDATAVHHPASTMKLPLLVALYRAADTGRLRLDDEITVTDRLPSVVPSESYLTTQDYDSDDAVWERLGQTASLRSLAARAIVRSSNLATNLLLDVVGVTAVNAVYDDLASSASRLARGIQDTPGAKASLENTATAADLAAVTRAVASRTAASLTACEQIENVLARCEDNEGLPAGLPDGTYVAHKPGWIEHVCHDVGIVRPEREPAFVLAIMTGAPLDEPDGFRLVADVAAVCWRHRRELASRAGRVPA